MARMTRTILSLPEDDKRWLDGYGRRLRISSAEVIRRAIREFRQKKAESSLDRRLEETAGAWTSGRADGRAFVDGLRREWDRKK